VPKGDQIIAKRVISEDIAENVVEMMQAVTEKDGTGYRARVPGIEVAGKTGTAYLVDKEGYDHQHYLASFVGFAPVKAPKLIVSVFVVAPDHAHYFGGLSAAPIFSSIVEKGLLRLRET
jgi:cell division protein FtsI (penicillin-binding protein 3)